MALGSFTAEFGMGSGAFLPAMTTRPAKGKLSLRAFGARNGKVLFAAICLDAVGYERRVLIMRAMKPIELLVPVSFTHCCASTPGLSTWWSSTALIGSTRFEVRFPLRCLQRLSSPYLATLQCGWRHNRSTRGMSIPVLSY